MLGLSESKVSSNEATPPTLSAFDSLQAELGRLEESAIKRRFSFINRRKSVEHLVFAMTFAFVFSRVSVLDASFHESTAILEPSLMSNKTIKAFKDMQVTRLGGFSSIGVIVFVITF